MLIRDFSPRPNMENIYKRVWSVAVLERVRVFLWLDVNQVLMTNEERFRRHIGDIEICPVCNGGVESIIHTLRDCLAMVGI